MKNRFEELLNLPIVIPWVDYKEVRCRYTKDYLPESSSYYVSIDFPNEYRQIPTIAEFCSKFNITNVSGSTLTAVIPDDYLGFSDINTTIEEYIREIVTYYNLCSQFASNHNWYDLLYEMTKKEITIEGLKEINNRSNVSIL